MSLLRKAAALAALAAIVGTSLYVVHLRGLIAARDRKIADAVADAAMRLGAVRAEALGSKELERRLAAENADLLSELKKIDERVRPVLHVESTAGVKDTVVLGPDEHRFVVSPDCLTVRREQRFRFDALVVENVDGTRLGSATVTELDPVTGEPVGGGALDVESRFQFVKDAPDRPVFHPRVVAGVESHGYPIAGVQVLNGERFGGVLAHTNLSVFGGYDVVDKTPFGGAVVGYRPFNWNLSVGPAAFWGSKGLSGGAAVTIELTR